MDTSETYKNLSDGASPLKPDYIVERAKWYEDPVYVKMCDCEEIQGEKPEREVVYKLIHERPHIGFDIWGNAWAPSYGGSVNDLWVWLPRQDQLQEMIGKPLWQLNFRFIDWLCDTPYDGHIRHSHLGFKSMEQLWFAYMMKTNHNKIWNGEEWEVISESV